MAQQKSRHWAAVVYPDSAPQDWIQELDEMHVRAFVSPLHDKDVNKETGEFKKPHWHVIVSFDGPVTPDYARNRLKPMFNCPELMAVASLSGQARYLCHMDNPEKFQYDPSEVQSFGGFNYFEVIQTNCDRLQAIGEMQQWCDDNDVDSFAELSRYARNNRRDWFMYLANSATVVMQGYLKSRAWEKKQPPVNTSIWDCDVVESAESETD